MDPIDSELPQARPRDALITTALTGRILGWSRGACALFGFREREILGRPLDDLLHEKHRAIDSQTVAEVTAGHCVRDAMVKYVRRDGAVLTCIQTSLPMRDATGRVTGIVRIVFDLTSLREAERSLRRMRAELEELAHDGAGEIPAWGSEHARNVQRERARTREHFLHVVEGEARQLGSELCGEIARCAERARAADEAELIQA